MLSFPFKSLLPEGSKNTYCARGRNYLKAVALLAADLQVISQITPSSSSHKNFKHTKHTHPHPRPRPHETACFLKILITLRFAFSLEDLSYILKVVKLED